MITSVATARPAEMVEGKGRYRPMFTRLLNSQKFLTLSADARATLYPLKLLLPATGIAVVPAMVATLAEYTALPEDRQAAALDELERVGWVRRDARHRLLWLVGGLGHEPLLNWKDPKHRAWVTGLLAELPDCELTRAFRERYADWFLDRPELLVPSEDGRPSEGPTEAPPEQRTRTRDRNRDRTTPPKPPAESRRKRRSAGTAVAVRTPDALVAQGREAFANVMSLREQQAEAERIREEMVALAFAYWALKLNHPGALQDPKRERYLRARLVENGNDINEVLFAADGARRDKHLMGNNDRDRRFDGIETIYRDRAQVERLAALGGYVVGKIHPQVELLMAQAQREAH